MGAVGAAVVGHVAYTKAKEYQEKRVAKEALDERAEVKQQLDEEKATFIRRQAEDEQKGYDNHSGSVVWNVALKEKALFYELFFKQLVEELTASTPHLQHLFTRSPPHGVALCVACALGSRDNFRNALHKAGADVAQEAAAGAGVHLRLGLASMQVSPQSARIVARFLNRMRLHGVGALANSLRRYFSDLGVPACLTDMRFEACRRAARITGADSSAVRMCLARTFHDMVLKQSRSQWHGMDGPKVTFVTLDSKDPKDPLLETHAERLAVVRGLKQAGYFVALVPDPSVPRTEWVEDLKSMYTHGGDLKYWNMDHRGGWFPDDDTIPVLGIEPLHGSALQKFLRYHVSALKMCGPLPQSVGKGRGGAGKLQRCNDPNINNQRKGWAGKFKREGPKYITLLQKELDRDYGYRTRSSVVPSLVGYFRVEMRECWTMWGAITGTRIHYGDDIQCMMASVDGNGDPRSFAAILKQFHALPPGGDPTLLAYVEGDNDRNALYNLHLGLRRLRKSLKGWPQYFRGESCRLVDRDKYCYIPEFTVRLAKRTGAENKRRTKHMKVPRAKWRLMVANFDAAGAGGVECFFDRQTMQFGDYTICAPTDHVLSTSGHPQPRRSYDGMDTRANNGDYVALAVRRGLSVATGTWKEGGGMVEVVPASPQEEICLVSMLVHIRLRFESGEVMKRLGLPFEDLADDVGDDFDNDFEEEDDDDDDEEKGSETKHEQTRRDQGKGKGEGKGKKRRHPPLPRFPVTGVAAPQFVGSTLEHCCALGGSLLTTSEVLSFAEEVRVAWLFGWG